MSNRNKEEIVSAVRNILIGQYNYQVEGGYLRKWISDNYGISFSHEDEYPLCISVCHRDETPFSTRQKSIIPEVLGRKEFSSFYTAPEEGTTSDGKPEYWTTLKINSFDGWENEDIAKRIVELYAHFINTVKLLDLT